MVISGTAQSSPEESYMQYIMQLYLMMIKTVVTVCKTHYSTDHQNVLLSNYVKAAVLQAHKKFDISALIFMEYMKDVPYCTLNLVKLEPRVHYTYQSSQNINYYKNTRGEMCRTVNGCCVFCKLRLSLTKNFTHQGTSRADQGGQGAWRDRQSQELRQSREFGWLWRIRRLGRPWRIRELLDGLATRPGHYNRDYIAPPKKYFGRN